MKLNPALRLLENWTQSFLLHPEMKYNLQPLTFLVVLLCISVHYWSFPYPEKPHPGRGAGQKEQEGQTTALCIMGTLWKKTETEKKVALNKHLHLKIPYSLLLHTEHVECVCISNLPPHTHRYIRLTKRVKMQIFRSKTQNGKMQRCHGKAVNNSVSQFCISYSWPKGKYFLFVDYA